MAVGFRVNLKLPADLCIDDDLRLGEGGRGNPVHVPVILTHVPLHPLEVGVDDVALVAVLYVPVCVRGFTGFSVEFHLVL